MIIRLLCDFNVDRDDDDSYAHTQVFKSNLGYNT